HCLIVFLIFYFVMIGFALYQFANSILQGKGVRGLGFIYTFTIERSPSEHETSASEHEQRC
ncbi:hypothetical protein, partial [Trichormus variabilis]|uniref:hypothetical protein n=1 Tax=Anabaena variabilis TaxID=264691 RepID=UPI0007FD62BE